ncbi:unnamed protein product [Merluccius merluccius]
METPRGKKCCGFETRMSGLQLAVYWRLCLIFFFNSFLFFLDLYTVCTGRHAHNRTDHRTGPEDGVLNGSVWRNERSEACVFVHAVCGVMPAALHHPLIFIALRCLTGVCCSCINICSFSLGVEWSVPLCRPWPPALLGFSFSLGMVVQAPLAYAWPSWTRLHLALGIPQILCLPVIM